MNHHIVIIHGIGKAQAGYSRPLSDGIVAAYAQRSHGMPAGRLIFHEVVWDDALAFEQARFADVLRRGFGLASRGTPLNLFEKIFFPKAAINCLRTDVTAEYIEDILTYNNKSNAYPLIHQRVRDALNRAAEDPQPGDLSIVAHSLGSVIASDHIYDCQDNGRAIAGGLRFRNFFTLGSPIALFALRYGGAEMFTKPARLEDPSGVWLNIFDKDDPIGYPLRTLNETYKAAVTEDVWVNTGWFGFAHVQYFKSGHVHRLIAGKL